MYIVCVCVLVCLGFFFLLGALGENKYPVSVSAVYTRSYMRIFPIYLKKKAKPHPSVRRSRTRSQQRNNYWHCYRNRRTMSNTSLPPEFRLRIRTGMACNILFLFFFVFFCNPKSTILAAPTEQEIVNVTHTRTRTPPNTNFIPYLTQSSTNPARRWPHLKQLPTN